jgi:hypothetical protein
MEANRGDSEPAAVETGAGPRQTRGGGVTLRAVLLGLVMVVVIVGMTQLLSIRYHAADVAGDEPPPAPTYFLFLYVLLLAPLLTKLSRRLVFSTGELLLIYTMMLVAGPITHLFGIGFLVPHAVAPHYFIKHDPDWSLFLPYLPSWLGPTDPKAVADFFSGTGGPVPWHAWLLPIIAWSSLLIALFWVMLCINTVMRRQWIDSERLVFPMAAIPVALAEEENPSTLRNPLRLTRAPLFWIGVFLVLALQAPRALNRYIPSVPALPLQDVVLINANSLSPPWNGLGQIEFDLLFWLIGIVYLLPSEIAFSGWAFYFIGLIENVVAVSYGTTGEAPDVYSNQFPALYAQGAGAAFALTGIALYMARGHLRGVLRKAFRGDPKVDDRDSPLSYRTAVYGTMLGTAFMLGWCCLGGMRLWVAALLFGLMLSYFFLFARIRAESGLGMGVILWPKMLDEVMLTLVGAKYLTLSDMTMLFSLRWLYFGPAIGSVMACQLEGFKLADAGGLRGRRVGRALAAAASLTVVLALCWSLKTYYTSGFVTLPIARRETSMVGTQIHWSYQSLVESHDTATGPQLSGILAILTGGLIAVGLSSLRTRLVWFPLHPIGFVAANSWGMQINWVSFFVGWLLKVLITRYGGLRVYNRLMPFFLGLIIGDALHSGLWGLVAWVTGGGGGR